MNHQTDKDMSEWDASYSVGIEKIDDQHKKLFELTALFYGQILDGADREILYRLLIQLRKYAENHFTDEELLFQNHPNFSFHQQIHQAFLFKIEQFEQDFQNWKENLADDILFFLRHWLVNHIIETDKRFLSPDSATPFHT